MGGSKDSELAGVVHNRDDVSVVCCCMILLNNTKAQGY